MGLNTFEPGPVRKLNTFEMFCSVEKVWEVEIGNVVADDDIWVDLLQEISPRHKHLILCAKLEYLSINNQTASIETENVANKRLRFSISCHNIRDLYDRILIGFWKDPFAASTLDIEREDSKWSHFRPFAIIMVSDQIPIMYVCLYLTVRMSFSMRNHMVFGLGSFHPRHSRNLQYTVSSEVCDPLEDLLRCRS